MTSNKLQYSPDLVSNYFLIFPVKTHLDDKVNNRSPEDRKKYFKDVNKKVDIGNENI